MLIMAFLSFCAFLIDSIFNVVFSVMNISEIPSSITSVVSSFFDILARGVDMFGFLIGPVGKILLGIIVNLETFHMLYKLIWFIIRKIPVLNIRE